MKFMKRLLIFTALPFQEKQLFMEALFFLYAAKILLLILPFRYCLKFLSNKRCKQENISEQQLWLIKKAVHRTRWLAFWKNECLVKSLASRWMLQRRQISSLLSLGAAFDQDKKLIAHAWLSINEFEIVEKGGSYYELYQF